jgi:uncharacterized repeat protein (TIGR01451 family)
MNNYAKRLGFLLLLPLMLMGTGCQKADTPVAAPEVAASSILGILCTPTPTVCMTTPTPTSVMCVATPTYTYTCAPPTNTPTFTCAPPTNTPTNTCVPPTNTFTPVPPSPTNTFTAVPPTNTYTFTPVPPTPTNTNTPIPPTPTNTFTAVPPTNTFTSTPVPPTPVPTSTPIPIPTVSITQTASELSAALGGAVTYTIHLTVSGCAAGNVMIQDVLPSGLSYVQGTATSIAGGAFTNTGSTLSWAYSTVGPCSCEMSYVAQVQNLVGLVGSALTNTCVMTCPSLASSLSASTSLNVTGLLGLGL